MMLKLLSTVTIEQWMFCRRRSVEAEPVTWMSRLCVTSEWPQMMVPPFLGVSCAKVAPGKTVPNRAAPPSKAVDFRSSLRFIGASPVRGSVVR